MLEKEKERTEFSVPPIQSASISNPLVSVDEGTAAAPIAWHHKINWRGICWLLAAWIGLASGAHLLVKVISSLSYNPALAELITLTEKGGLFPIPIAQKAAYDPQPAGGSFTGPGDVTSGAAAFWSCARGYSAAYAAPGNNPACDLVDSSTGLVTFTMNILSTGFADVAGALASTACAVACKVKKAYDQSGANQCSGSPCDVSQATLANMPNLTFNVLGGLPAMTFITANAQKLTSGTMTTFAQPNSYSAVARRTANFTTTACVWGDGAPNTQWCYTNSINGMRVFAGSSVVPFPGTTDNVFNALQLMINGASSSKMVDGTNASLSNPGTASRTGTNIIGQDGFVTGFLEGQIMEFIFWNGDKSANNASMNANQHGTSGYNF